MPTVADLEKLESLIATLKQLDGKQRGELIEAETWNRLVGAVIEIGRVSLVDQDSQEVGRHSHHDQVSLEWLDPKLRAIVLEGGLSDPGASAEVSKLQRQIAKFGRLLNDLSGRIDRIQGDVSGVATRDVEREVMVGSALRKLDGVFDARGDIASLRGSLRLIEGQVRTAADLSLRLQDDDGEEIDFNGLSTRLTQVETLQDALKLPDGATFDAQAYSRDLAQLRAELVTEAELSEALDNVKSGFSGDLRDELLEGARAAALEGNAAALASLGQDLRDEQTTGLRKLEDSIPGQIEAATGDLSDQILTAARAEQAETLDSRLSRFSADRDAQIDTRFAALSNDFGLRIDSLNTTINGDIDTSVSKVLDSRLSEFNGRIADLEGTDAGLRDDIKELSGQVDSTDVRLSTVQRELQAAAGRISANLTQRVASIEGALEGRIKDTDLATRAAMRAEMQDDLSALRETLTAEMTRNLRVVAKAEVDIATARLRGEMSDIAKTEIDGGLAEIRSEVAEAGAVSNARLSGLVASEVRRATSDLDQRIKTSVESFEVQRNRTVRRDTRVITPIEPIRR